MPLLQSNLAGRMAGSGLGEGSLQDSLALASFASLATVETFRDGPFVSLRASMLGERDAGIFRWGPDGPLAKNSGPGGDTVPGNTGTAFVLTVGGPSQNGFVNTVGDDDWYRVELTAGQSYVFTLVGSGGAPLLDPYLELYDSGGNLMSINDDSGPGFTSLLRFTAVQSGTYYINARAFEPTSEPALQTGQYSLAAAIGPPQNPLDTIDYHYTVPTSSIQVYFATTGQTFGTGVATATALRSWTQAEMNAAMAALATFGQIAPLTFSTTLNQAEAEFTLVLADLEDNVLAWFSPPIGVGAFAPDTTSWTTPGSLSPGGSAFAALIHEFGHAFGLAHPHDEGGVGDGNGDLRSEIMQGVISEFNSYGTFSLNQGVFTVMSYNDGSLTVGSTLTQGNPQTPMALDIALLQDRYGVNATAGQGDSVYTIGAVNALRAIWDVSGIDTIVYNGANMVTIDLRAATLLSEAGGGGFISFAQGVRSGFTIANGVTIENATGGSGDDTLIGNAAANLLTGNSGFDTLNGNGGNDRLNGGAGADLLNGSAGVDTAVYTSLSTSATWVRNPNGNWSVSGDTLNSVEFLEFSDRDVFLDRAARTFSGDGVSDLLLRNSASGSLVMWANASAASGAHVATLTTAWGVVSAGDFNGDGKDDILWRNSSNGNMSMWFMNGASVIGSAGFGVGLAWSIAGTGDVNGDTRDDIVWRNAGGDLVLWFMDGGAITSASLGNVSPDWAIEILGDFNGDGRDDFIWRNSATGDMSMWLMDGAAAVGGQFANVGVPWEIAGVGDFSGDGRDDVIWRNPTTGDVSMWFMNGDVIASSAGFNIAAAWSVAMVGDFNGDGKDDLLWRNTATGDLVAWHMNGATVVGSAFLGNLAAEWGVG